MDIDSIKLNGHFHRAQKLDSVPRLIAVQCLVGVVSRKSVPYLAYKGSVIIVVLL
jgi:hypothetical protein